MLEFAWPWVFILLPLPWLLWRWLAAAQPAEALHLPYSGLHLASGTYMRRPGWHVVLLSLSWLCLLAAAARPQWLGPPQPLVRSGRALMLAVDLSGSMATPDMRMGGYAVSRFAAVEAIASDFISRRVGDRLGLILFGTHAYLVTPLTYDLSAVRAQLQGAVVGLPGTETAIGDAVGVAVKALRKLPAKARVMVLMTDGVNDAGSLQPQQAARIAKAAGVRIYTIGIGAAPKLLYGFIHSVENSSSGVGAAVLKSMARSTGGRFFRASDTRQLAAAYRTIDALEPVPNKGRSVRPRHELFRWPLMAALLLALAAVTLRHFVLRGSETTP